MASVALLAKGMAIVHGRHGVVGQLQVHAVRGALGGHHALQHVKGRLVGLVGEVRGQRLARRCCFRAQPPGRPWWSEPLVELPLPPVFSCQVARVRRRSWRTSVGGGAVPSGHLTKRGTVPSGRL